MGPSGQAREGVQSNVRRRSHLDLKGEELRAMLTDDRFPLSAKYDPEWILANTVGAHSLWLTEMLCRKLDLRPGMRVLDIGCGRAACAIFMAREFGVRVWAIEPDVDPADNWRRAVEAGVGDLVCPMRGDAHHLPFARGFFDVVTGINSFQFFATDELYLLIHVARLIPKGGRIGLILPAVFQDFERGEVPPHLRPYWRPEYGVWHTAGWWRDHWRKSGVVHVDVAETLPEGPEIWTRWIDAHQKEDLIHADAGRYITFMRLIAHRV